MSNVSSEDYLTQYRLISSKLKKRFLRKPNVSEASDEYTSLALRCEGSPSLEFAGLCWLGAARCESSLGHTCSETDFLLRSARLFVRADVESKFIGCPNPGKENLQEALNCYSHAISRYPDNSPLRYGVRLEASEALCGEMMSEVTCQPDVNHALAMRCLSTKASKCIMTGDYNGALDVLTELSKSIKGTTGIHRDMLQRCEVSRVLLLLILEPPPGSLSTPLASLLEKYSWTDFNQYHGAFKLPETLSLYLHALVAAWQSKDTNAICEMRPTLAGHLSQEQRTLLDVLVRNLCE